MGEERASKVGFIDTLWLSGRSGEFRSDTPTKSDRLCLIFLSREFYAYGAGFRVASRLPPARAFLMGTSYLAWLRAAHTFSVVD